MCHEIDARFIIGDNCGVFFRRSRWEVELNCALNHLSSAYVTLPAYYFLHAIQYAHFARFYSATSEVFRRG